MDLMSLVELWVFGVNRITGTWPVYLRLEDTKMRNMYDGEIGTRKWWCFSKKKQQNWSIKGPVCDIEEDGTVKMKRICNYVKTHENEKVLVPSEWVFSPEETFFLNFFMPNVVYKWVHSKPFDENHTFLFLFRSLPTLPFVFHRRHSL